MSATAATHPMQGMTGFGRASGTEDWGSWLVEVKSVNGRSLDVRSNMPQGFDALETHLKAAAKARFTRGSLQVAIRIDLANSAETVTIDQTALNILVAEFDRRTGHAPDDLVLAEFLTARGVLVAASGSGLRDLANDDAAMQVMRDGVDAAFDALLRVRHEEGSGLRALLHALLEHMEAARQQAEALAATVPDSLKARLMRRLDDLGGIDALDTGRLEAEAALLANKADVREELDRLKAHIAQGQALLAGGGAIGRKLDFLTQELGRETNTLCSKSASLDLTQLGLELKSLIDQFKEQAANAE